MSRILFITGTDTGVGKTLLTALLVRYLRDSGVNALAMKPFCSGGRGDVDLIQAMQSSALPEDWVNPFYFPEPVAPLVAVRQLGRKLRMAEALIAIRRVAQLCDCLLVEGSGGLLVPLGEGFAVADLIAELQCFVVVVARNQLGTINHTVLTIEALRARRKKRIKVVLMEPQVRDPSALTNAGILEELVSPVRVDSLPYLGGEAATARAVKRNAKKLKKTLARIVNFATFSPRSLGLVRKRMSEKETESEKVR